MRLAALLLPALLLAACGQTSTGTPGATAAATGAGPAPVCGLSPAQLGTPIASEAGFTVHDTAPGSTEARVHHVTGFDDGCARAVTAALVLFGDVATHETTLAAAPGGGRSPTDAVYEAIRSRVCGVLPGQPCGPRLPRLAEDTVFLSLYPVFGADEHTDLLLHAGEVAAADARLAAKS